jgi:hypothetical protein
MKDGVNGASGGNAHVGGKPSDQELADLASAPMRLVVLEGQDEAFDLLRELVGIAHRPPRTVVEGLEAMLLAPAAKRLAEEEWGRWSAAKPRRSSR